MRSKILLCLKIGWCVAAVMILLMGTNICTATDDACAAAGDSMFLFMLVLSFPAGVVFLIGSLIFLDFSVGHYPADFIFAWLIMACGGFLQWFVIAPRLFDKPKFTVLDLKPIQVPVPAISQVISAPSSPALVTDSQIPRVVQRPRTRAPKRRNRVAAFDVRGQTPLERVINH
jgi:hypothetical protein